MATLSFSCSSPCLNYQSQALLSHPSHLPYALSSSCNLLKGPKKNGNPYISSCNNPVPHTKKGVQVKGECVSKRRELLLQAGSVAFSLSAFSSIALAENDVTEDFRVYSDDVNKFKITIPRDWQIGAGEGDGVRSLIAFYPQEASNTNVSIVITSLGADFTKLESFGKVDAFAENLVSGLDRSWQRPAGVKAKLIDSKASKVVTYVAQTLRKCCGGSVSDPPKIVYFWRIRHGCGVILESPRNIGLYYIEYTLQNPGESLRHLFSVLGIANNGIYNRLYTLTGQFVDEEAEKYGAKVEKAVSSFRLI